MVHFETTEQVCCGNSIMHDGEKKKKSGDEVHSLSYQSDIKEAGYLKAKIVEFY